MEGDDLLGNRLRVIGLIVVAGLAAWWARNAAHSKLPQPEGRWREVTLGESDPPR